MSEYKPIDECKTVVELLAIPKRWAKNPGPRCNCYRGDKWHTLGRYNDRAFCRIERSTNNAEDLDNLAAWVAGHLAVHVAAASKANYQPGFADWNDGGF